MKYSAKQLIIDMTNMLNDLERYDVESAATALKIRQMRETLLSSATLKDRENIPKMEDLYKIYLDYTDRTEEINKKIERICQLLLTNPWVINTSPDIPEHLLKDTMDKVDDIMLKLSERRMHSLDMRTWIVQQQMKKMWMMS